MFVSQPQYEFPFPPDLEQPGSQYWRMVELTLHAPWFLLSVETRLAALERAATRRRPAPKSFRRLEVIPAQ